MIYNKILAGLCFLLLAQAAMAQKIVYSEPGNDDTRRMDFEIIGKVSGNFLIYKQMKGKSFVSVYNTNMEEIDKVEQEYIPDDRLIKVDFFPYSDFTYLMFQYQKKNVVYCNAVKLDGSGKRISEIKTLDTTHLSFAANNKIYATIGSEDKSKLMVFKINSKNKSRFVISTLLFDADLNLKNESEFAMPMNESHDNLSEFSLDNDGDLVFTKFVQNNNETISSATMLYKSAEADTLLHIPIPQDKLLLDELHVKVDNVNKRYFLTSFYYTKKRGNIEGFYFYVWDKQTQQPTLTNSVAFSEELRNEAKGDANIKTAFNDYFIRDIIIKRDGGFVINTEAYYTSSRGGGWNRWNYLYGYPINSFDYYSSYSPIYNSWYWRDRYNNSQSVRRHADNVTVLSFDNSGKLSWSGVIHKEQFDEDSDDRISFITVNTGSQIHYLFNIDEKRALLLNDFTLSPGGQLNHNPTLKNLDRGYEFLPRYGKQVSATQVIIPCYYRNYICFAKIEFN
jgi:hypothetical protein